MVTSDGRAALFARCCLHVASATRCVLPPRLRATWTAWRTQPLEFSSALTERSESESKLQANREGMRTAVGSLCSVSRYRSTDQTLTVACSRDKLQPAPAWRRRLVEQRVRLRELCRCRRAQRLEQVVVRLGREVMTRPSCADTGRYRLTWADGAWSTQHHGGDVLRIRSPRSAPPAVRTCEHLASARTSSAQSQA